MPLLSATNDQNGFYIVKAGVARKATERGSILDVDECSEEFETSLADGLYQMKGGQAFRFTECSPSESATVFPPHVKEVAVRIARAQVRYDLVSRYILAFFIYVFTFLAAGEVSAEYGATVVHITFIVGSLVYLYHWRWLFRAS